MNQLMALLLLCAAAPTGAAEGPTWLERIQRQERPYIGNYYAPRGLEGPVGEELFQDLLRMGITGLQDQAFYGAVESGRFFRQRGYDGLVWQTYYSQPDPVLDAAGQPVGGRVAELYGCLSSERNMEAGAEQLARLIREHQDGVRQVEGLAIFSSWDETGLQYQTYDQNPLCREAFRRWLQDRYGDASPNGDSSGDGRICNAELGTNWESWEQVPLPQVEHRFAQPLLWKTYLDWNGWQTFEYFRQVERRVNEKGVPFAFMTFPHSTQFWPGAAHIQGLNPLRHAEQSPILLDEQCIADFPVASITSSWCDRLSRDYQKPAYAYSWFWPGWRDGENDFYFHSPDDINRALGRKIGHTCHGLIFWVYELSNYHYLPEVSREVAYWHHFLQKHWNWLKVSPPVKEDIAVLWPGYSAYFYARRMAYPKQNFGWGPAGLYESQFPFTILQEEEVEAGALRDYKVLYAFGVERTSRRVLEEIRQHVARGGYVFADCDSFLMDLQGERTDLLEDVFGIRLEKKYKSPVQPSQLSLAEYQWAEALEEKPDPLPEPPTQTPTGLAQTLLDPAARHYLSLSPQVAPGGALRTFHDVCTGTAVKGTVLGTFRGQAVGVETERTVWFGQRPGFDFYAVFPEEVLAMWGEPLYPYFRASTHRAAQRERYRRVLAYLAEKAGVMRPVSVWWQDRLATHVEVIVRQNPQSQALMVFLVNHDPLGGPHEVRTTLLQDGWTAWDVTRNEEIESPTDGRFTLDLDPQLTRVLFFGPPAEVERIREAQAALLAMDLRPQPFTVGPKVLEEPPLPEVQIAAAPEGATLPAGEVARLRVRVRNPAAQRQVAVPVILPVRDVALWVDAPRVEAVRLAGGPPAQWDDLDGIPEFSGGDEIVWQTNLEPGEEQVFDLCLGLAERPAPAPEGGTFAVSTDGDSASFARHGETFFTVTKDNRWKFPTASHREMGGPQFGCSEAVGGKITVRADGPVRKMIEIAQGYAPLEPVPEGTEKEVPSPVQTRARYALYGQATEGETRLYVQVEHEVTTDLLGRPRGPMPGGTLLSLTSWGEQGGYQDTLGRLGRFSDLTPEKNFGGWLVLDLDEAHELAVLAQRTKGVLQADHRPPDEQDGVQLEGASLVRAARSINAPDIRQGFDHLIRAGNRWRLNALLVLGPKVSPEAHRALREAYANPPVVTVEQVQMAGQR